jgi:hypothetical protein
MARARHGSGPDPTSPGPAGHHDTASPGDPPADLAQLAGMSREAIQQAIIDKSTILLLHS